MQARFVQTWIKPSSVLYSIDTLHPGWGRIIAIGVSVCLSVCLSAGIPHIQSLRTFLYMLPGASTPYKRWSKCTMKKIRGEGFCRT